jgi:hypothetical protein
MAKKNASTGLGALLFKKKDLEREKAQVINLRDTITMHSNGSHEKENAEQMLLRLITANSTSAIRVQVADEEFLKEIEDDIRDLTHKVDSVADSINDINAVNKVKIALDADVAQLLGL